MPAGPSMKAEIDREWLAEMADADMDGVVTKHEFSRICKLSPVRPLPVPLQLGLDHCHYS